MQQNRLNGNPQNGGTGGFERFWAVYPRTEAKQAAWKAWKKLKVDENPKLFSEIMAGIVRHGDDWACRELRYIPLPATFLNGRRWEDELNPNAGLSPGERRTWQNLETAWRVLECAGAVEDWAASGDVSER
jgi:hypothetical protein